MKPIGLTFKHEGLAKQGELMLVHECASCPKISINRIARDDGNDGILNIFTSSCSDGRLRVRLNEQEICLLGESDEREVRIQLFGQ
jgi:hypothetical protein